MIAIKHPRVALLAAALATISGCSYDFCRDYLNGDCDIATGGQGGASTSTSTSAITSTTDGSSSTGVVADCVPTLTLGPKDDTCGVFVDPTGGVDGAAGTMAAPLRTLAAATAAWTAGKAIYVCDGALGDDMGVSLTPGMIVYGGLDCTATFRIKADSARTALAPMPGQIPLTFAAGASAIELHRFEVTATAAAAAGSSAVGIVVGDVPVSLNLVDVTAGDGVAGTDSVTPTDNIGPTDPNDAMIRGNDGAPANSTTPATKNPGGPAKLNPFCNVSVGGSGGDGGEIVGVTPQNGVSGNAGSTTPASMEGPPNDGMGGLGAMLGGCGAGAGGGAGNPVLDGVGAAGAATLGTIGPMGYLGVAGGPGGDGNPGQGGGGGGGAKGKHLPAPDTRGASGGSGGAGGCGGKGAPGGGPGGASIALVILGATPPTLTGVTLTAGAGGAGGDGAAGQFGATGGNGGAGGNGASLGLNDACNGGKGGKGSNGGAGGGGRGGHALGIAYVTAAPASGFTVVHGAAGAAGATAGAGVAADPGVEDDTLQLGN